jgi:uncharacterized membrane protein
MKDNPKRNDRVRLIAIILVSLFVIVTGAFFSITALMRGDVAGAILGGLIALIVLAFAIIVFVRGSSDMKKGFPLQDERSKRVMEKAATKAFYVSLYLLLALGFLSDEIIKFRDVSQATSVAVGGMALIWIIFWAYYNGKEI